LPLPSKWVQLPSMRALGKITYSDFVFERKLQLNSDFCILFLRILVNLCFSISGVFNSDFCFLFLRILVDLCFSISGVFNSDFCISWKFW
jgi:hypothetical protein